jgi:hypothetical protein
VVTGTGTIQTILIPPGYNGTLYLISRDGFSTTVGGNIAQTIAAPPTSLVTLVYAPQEGLFYITSISVPNGSIGTAQLAPGAVTTPILASGAASEGTPVIDNTVQNIAPYNSYITIATITVSIASSQDFVHITGRSVGNFANCQSGDGVTVKVFRDSTMLDSVAASLTLSTSTVVGGVLGAAFSLDDNSTLGLTSGSHTYTIQMASMNGSANGTFAVQKTSCWVIIIDLKAQ